MRMGLSGSPCVLGNESKKKYNYKPTENGQADFFREEFLW